MMRGLERVRVVVESGHEGERRMMGWKTVREKRVGSFPSTGTNNRPVYSFRFNLPVIRSKNEWEKIKLMFVGRIGNNSTWVLHSMTRDDDQRTTVIGDSLQESLRSRSIRSS